MTMVVLPPLHAADETAAFATEVKSKGWIVFSARSEKGDWDLFLIWPDGSQRPSITNTPVANEAYPLFSRDGTRLLYRRLGRDEIINGNNYGRQVVPVVSDSNGINPKPERPS